MTNPYPNRNQPKKRERVAKKKKRKKKKKKNKMREKKKNAKRDRRKCHLNLLRLRCWQMVVLGRLINLVSVLLIGIRKSFRTS